MQATRSNATVNTNTNANAPRSSQPEKIRAATNGHPRDSLFGKDSNVKVHKTEHQTLPPLKHGLPPRPQSPPKEKDPKQQKRPLESASTPAEKRTKIEQSRTPAGSQHTLPRKSDARAEKPSPAKSQKQQAQDSPHSRKVTPLMKPVDSKSSSKSNSSKPLDLPPLLSPLPADLENGPSSQSSVLSHLKKPESGRNSSSNTPSKSRIASDTIVVKSHRSENRRSAHVDSPPISSLPKSQSAPFTLPPLLSPGLPEPIEQELQRLQQKAQTTNTVEARHEKARQPGAPGVAQKAPRSKVGHPPKRSQAESSKSQEPERAEPPRSLVVKLKYKKQSRKTVERILNLRPSPIKEYTPPDPPRKTNLKPSALPKDSTSTSDSEEDTPLSVAAPKSAPASRKRPLAEPPRTSESAPKRPKQDSLDVARSNNTPVKPTFKSPARSAPPDRNLLSTPKKGDAMKTVAMRRVDSTDSAVRTPQATSTSTPAPASAEKPSSRTNGEPRPPPNPEVEKLRAEEKNLTAQASKLKHKMDDIIKFKPVFTQAQREAVTDREKKLGLATGLEGIMLYMNAFAINIRICRMQNIPFTAANWESVLKLWQFIDPVLLKFPVLYALSARLGALCREELRRVYLEGREAGERKDKVLEVLRLNEREQYLLWRRVNSSRSVLGEFGGDFGELGPWSSVQDATGFLLGVLGRWERKEKVGWKKDE